MRRYRTTGRDGTIVIENAADPEPGHGEVRIDLRAASLNYRDLIVAQRFPGVVPASDGAGVVSALGPGVEGVSLGEFDGSVDTAAILERRITLQGIYVGPVATLQSLVATSIAPQIDQVFPFLKAPEAYEALRVAGHVGKIAVTIGA